MTIPNIPDCIGKGSIPKICLGAMIGLNAILLAACRQTPPPATPIPAAPSPTAEPTTPPTATPTPSPEATPRLPTSSPAPAPPTATPRPTAAPTPTPNTPAGSITIGLVGNLSTMNPLTDLNPLLGQLAPLLYPPALRTDPQTARLEPKPGVDASTAAGGLALTYTLGLSGPAPADMQASLNAALWPELDSLRRVTRPDPGALVVTLTQPDCALADAVAQLPILPASQTGAPFPPGRGPFVVDDWSPGDDTLRLTANPAAAPPPRLQTITVRLFADEAAARQALQAGELDLLPLTAPPGELPAGFRSLTYLAPLLTFVAFNTGDDILGAATVRQALSHAVNRTQILQTAFGGFGTLAAGILPPAHWAANPDLPIPGYDPALAAAMLNAAGLTDGDGDGWRDLPGGGPWQPAIRVEAGNRTEEAAALLVAGDYRRIGVQAQAEPVPFETLIDDLLTHDYQAAVYSLPVPATLDRRARWHSDQIEAEFGLNLAAYANPQVDGWLDAANTVRHCAPEARAALYRQIQAQLVEDRPVDFLVAPTYFVVVKESLAGVAPGPFAPLTWNAASWDLLE